MEATSNKNRIFGIDLFSGAGGMTLGATQAGIEVICAVESCPHAAATYRRNFPKIPLLQTDIHKVLTLPRGPSRSRTVIFGGPPCQGFSTSNQRTRNSENLSNWLHEEFVRVVKLWKPDLIVMENVKGITQTEGGKFLTAALAALDMAGYSASFGLLNAVDYGVPQRRTRAFIVGARSGNCPDLPQAQAMPEINVRAAIGDLPRLSNGANIDELAYRRKSPSPYAVGLRKDQSAVTGNLVTRNAPHIIDRYGHVPPGGNWTSIPKALLSNYTDRSKCHTGIYRRLDPSTASVVIGNFRKNMLIHPIEDRGLSIREAARIQSIPDDFVFSGSIGFQQQQVGNMVPPPLARAVFTKVLAG